MARDILLQVGDYCLVKAWHFFPNTIYEKCKIHECKKIEEWELLVPSIWGGSTLGGEGYCEDHAIEVLARIELNLQEQNALGS